MPSPVGHSVIGFSVAAGWILPRCGSWKALLAEIRRLAVPLFLFVLFANVIDVDYVPGVLSGSINAYHPGYTHTLGWAALVSVGTWLCWRAVRDGVGIGALMLLLVLALTHLFADMLTDDGAPPYGIMFLWPFTETYYLSPAWLFPHLEKADWHEVFQAYNVKIMGIEVLITLPMAAGVLLLKNSRRSSADSS